MKRASLIAALCILLLPIVGLADTITFGLGSDNMSGSANVTVSSGNIYGSGITIGNVTGGGGLSGSYTVTGGVLSFQGNGETAVSLGPAGTYYSFTLTSLTITGTASSQAVTLSFIPGTGTAQILETSNSGWTVDLGGVPVTPNSNLLTLFGLSPSLTGGWSLNGDVTTYVGDSCVLTNTCGSGDFTLAPSGTTDTAQHGPVPPPPPPNVPEPATLSMLGVGLIGLLGVGRRRREVL